MKTITERLKKQGIESKFYKIQNGSVPKKYEEQIRDEFGKPLSRWFKAQTDSLTYSLPIWGWNTLTKKRDMSPNNVPRETFDEMKRLTDESDFKRVFALGHSTGADVLRKINARGGLNEFSGVVLASPTSNGYIPGLKEKILFGNKCNYHDPRTNEGRYNIELMQTPLDIPGITISYLNDYLVPMHASLDMSGDNLVVANYGHVTGTGGHKVGNIVYLESLKSLS